MYKDLPHSLYEVDHAGLGVGHLPILRQSLLGLVPGQHAPGPEVHGAAGLRVARHRLPPISAFFVLCDQRYNRERRRRRGKVWIYEKMQGQCASRH